MDSWRKSIPGRKVSKSEGSESVAHLAYLKSTKETAGLEVKE